MGKKKTTEDFINEARAIHGDRYDYSKSVYTGIFNKITIICPIHGEFEQIAHGHLRGAGCKLCNSGRAAHIKNEKAKKSFINRATEKTNGKYDLSEVNYIDTKTKIKVICHEKNNGKEHGAFYITPSNLLSLYGCPKCAAETTSIRSRLPYEKYQALVDKKYGKGLYTVDKISYATAPYKVKIYCNVHKEYFIVSPRDFPSATVYRCPECRKDVNFLPKEGRNPRTVKNIDKLQLLELSESVKARVSNGEEVWVPVRGHDNYIVSSEGRVKKINRTSRFGNPLPDYLCSLITELGGRRVAVCIDGKQRAVHKVVFESFYNMNIPKGYTLTVDHIDTNPLNNSLLNLRLCRGIKDNMVNNPLTLMHLCKENKNKGNSLLFDINNIEGEIWKPCIGYEGLYSVSNIGRVKAEERILIERNTGIKRIKRPHLMKQHLKDGRSYAIGLINRNGEHKNHFVHRLEYEAFFGKIPDEYEIDHIDSNPQNNNLENLRACSHRENALNPNSRKKRTPPKTHKGVKIGLLNNNEEVIKTFSSICECASYFNVCSTSIDRIISGKIKNTKILEKGHKLVRLD